MLNAHQLAENMKKWPYFLVVTLLVAIGIILCAQLGRSLGIQGAALAISVVWPATGFSLAALLLFGYWAGVGVFLGNLIHNLFFISFHPSPHITSFYIAAVVITIGSLAQALMSTFIIRAYSTPLVFRTVQDILIFLIPASALSCIIGSTVAIATLVISGGLNKSLALLGWLTFWLGDTTGIYVVTPLIVIWSLQKQESRFSDHIPSLVCMVFLFVLFSWVTYFVGYPLPHLFVPISIWAAYLFRMHGASLAIFLMTAASIAFAASRGYEGTSLISLITFNVVTIAASLIIAAVVNEREQAWALLDSRNIYLEKEIDVKVEILKQVKSEGYQKRKQDSSQMLQQIYAPLNDIDKVTRTSQKVLDEIQKLLTENAGDKTLFSEKIHRIRQGLSDTMISCNLISNVLESLKKK